MISPSFAAKSGPLTLTNRFLILSVACVLASAPALADENAKPNPKTVTVEGKSWKVTSGAAPGYVPDEACAECHETVFEAYQSMGMANSFTRADDAKVIEDFENNHFYHEASDRHYEMNRVDGSYVLTRYRMDKDGGRYAFASEKVDWILGSGTRGRVYFYQTELGELFVLPLVWNHQEGHWGMAVGYDRPNHHGFTQQIMRKCMFCHNGYPDVPEGSDTFAAPHRFPTDLPEGTGCQRCHGPGAEHVRIASNEDSTIREVRAEIVDPMKLDPKLREEACLQCHYQPSIKMETIGLRLGKGRYSYVPGQPLESHHYYLDWGDEAERAERFEINHHAYRLQQSRCVTADGETLSCLRCHDPHRKLPESERAEHYRETCLACHAKLADHPSEDEAIAGSDATNDCTVCHMPNHRAQDVPQATMTDHLIRRAPAPEDWTEPIPEDRHPTREEAEFVWEHLAPAEPLGALYRSMASVPMTPISEHVEKLRKAVEATRPEEADPYLMLAKAELILGQNEQAAETSRKLIARHPDISRGYVDLGRAMVEMGEIDEGLAMLQTGIDKDRLDPIAHMAMGFSLIKADRLDEARASLAEAVRLRPTLTPVHWELGNQYLQSKLYPESASHFETVIRLDPDRAAAYAKLGEVLTLQEKWPAAITVLRHGLATDSEYHEMRKHLAWAITHSDPTKEGRKEAVALGRQVLKHAPEDRDSMARLPLYLLKNGNAEEALVAVEAMKEHEIDPISVALIEAIALHRLGKTEPAMAAYAQSKVARNQSQAADVRPLLQRMAERVFEAES